MENTNCDTYSVVSFMPYDVSDDADVYTSCYPKDSKSIKEVTKQYITTIRRISNEIGDMEPSATGESLSQRLSTQSSLLPLPTFSISALVQEKMRFLNALTTFFKENKPISFPRYRAEASMEILESFTKENEECKKTIESLEAQLEYEMEEHKRLQDQLKMLEKMKNFNQIENEKKEEKEARKALKEITKDLNAVLELIMPESNLQEAFNELMVLSEKNEWYDATKNEEAVPLFWDLTRQGILKQEGLKFQLKI